MSSLLELLRAKKQDLAAGKRRKTIKPAEGSTRFRILPSWRKSPDQPFWADFGQHFIKNHAGEIQSVYMCTDKTFKKPCAVCEAVKQGIKSATDDATMKILKDASSSARVLVNAIKFNNDGTASDVEILELAPTVFDALVTVMEEWEAAGQSLMDPVNGRDVLINRTGSGLNTKYTVMASAKMTPVPAGALDKLHDLDQYVQQESTELATRALNSVRAVAGLLPAPSASGLPAAAAAAGMAIADEYEAAPAPARAAAAAPAPGTFEDVPWVETVATPAPAAVAPAPVAAAAPAARPAPVAPVAPAAPAASAADDELDALLQSLI